MERGARINQPAYTEEELRMQDAALIGLFYFLDAEHGRALIMRHILQLPYEDISRELGVSEAESRRAACDALGQLQRFVNS